MCVGSGFRVTWKTLDTSSNLYFRDPKGRVTTKNICRTCSDLDHVSGPLKHIDMTHDHSARPGTMVIEILQSELIR
jgi:hypothetical protein